MQNRQPVQFSFGGPTTPYVKMLLIGTAAGFFVQAITQRFLGVFLPEWLGLVPYSFTHRLFLWQPITYLFLHGGVFHLLFNLLVLWMFGCELERVWGSRFFLKYFFVCGIGAGVFVALVTPSSPVPTIGSSGALYGILLAYGLLFPDRRIFLWFVLPIRAKHFVLFIGAVAFYSTLTLPGSGISHLAHLSGFVIGYLYLRGWGHFRRLHRRYLEWKLKRLKKKFRVIDGGNDPDEPPYIH
jgi:membrane associated rhomboid family serine protease